jgi:hypothetical protein
MLFSSAAPHGSLVAVERGAQDVDRLVQVGLPAGDLESRQARARGGPGLTDGPGPAARRWAGPRAAFDTVG